MHEGRILYVMNKFYLILATEGIFFIECSLVILKKIEATRSSIEKAIDQDRKLTEGVCI